MAHLQRAFPRVLAGDEPIHARLLTVKSHSGGILIPVAFCAKLKSGGAKETRGGAEDSGVKARGTCATSSLAPVALMQQR